MHQDQQYFKIPESKNGTYHWSQEILWGAFEIEPFCRHLMYTSMVESYSYLR